MHQTPAKSGARRAAAAGCGARPLKVRRPGRCAARVRCAARSKGRRARTPLSAASAAPHRARARRSAAARQTSPSLLRCSPPPIRSRTPQPTSTAQRVVPSTTTRWSSCCSVDQRGRRYPAGAICGSARSAAARVGVHRRCALRVLTRRPCLNEANEVSVVSSAARPLTRAPQWSRRCRRRPTQHEPRAGTACRAARVSAGSGTFSR